LLFVLPSFKERPRGLPLLHRQKSYNLTKEGVRDDSFDYLLAHDEGHDFSLLGEQKMELRMEIQSTATQGRSEAQFPEV
jgi:hypothetical protein